MFSYWAKPAGRARSFAPVKRSHRRSRARSSEEIRGPGNDSDARSRSGGGRIGTLRSRTGFARRADRHARRRKSALRSGSTVLNLDNASLQPVWSAAEQLNAAIFVHPWDMVGKERMPKYWLPWLVGMPAETSLAICSMIFGGVFERFPKLRVAFAHGGGAFPFTIGRIEHALSRAPGFVRHRHQDESATVISPTATRPRVSTWIR